MYQRIGEKSMNKYNELADLKKYYPDFKEYLFEKKIGRAHV